jgi:hypothetical protein
MKKSTPTRGQGRGLPLKGEAEKQSGRGRSGARRLAVPTLPADSEAKATAKGGRASSGKTARARQKGKPLSKRELAVLRRLPIEGISLTLQKLAVPIAQLHPDPENVRRHPERNIEAIQASMERFGQQAPVVYVVRRGKKVIIKGNGMLAAAKALHWAYLAAVESGLKEREAMAFAIADNRTGELSDWDEKLLASQLAELDSVDLTAVGFTDAEYQELLKVGTPEAGEGEEGEEAKPKRSKSLGELFAVTVECKNDRDQLAFYRRMQKEGRKCKLCVL